MAGRKAKAPKVNETSVKLLEALRFVSIAQKDVGAPNHTHCQFFGGRLCATDGILTVGCTVDEDINANPHTGKLIAALKHCGQQLKITQYADSLAILSGAFRAVVPGVSAESFLEIAPDAPLGPLDERLRDSFRAVGPLATEGAQSILCASVLLGPGYAVATDRHCMIQHWHGLELPPNIVLPKTFVAAVLKVEKPLKAFGWSPLTFTVWFADDSFMKTQLFAEPWPDWQKVIDAPSNPKPVPADLAIALDSVEPFCERDIVYFGPNVLESHRGDEGAKYQLKETLSAKQGTNVKHLRLALPYATTFDFSESPNMLFFFGENIRGCICSIREP